MYTCIPLAFNKHIYIFFCLHVYIYICTCTYIVVFRLRFPTTGFLGEGIYEGLDWLSKAMPSSR